MFDATINAITISEFTNRGIAYKYKDKEYLFKNDEMINVEDFRGKYFWALKEGVDYSASDITSCGYELSQIYIFKFVSDLPFTAFIIKHLIGSINGIDNDVNLKGMSLVSSVESKITETLYLNEVKIELFGSLNSCNPVLPCKC